MKEVLFYPGATRTQFNRENLRTKYRKIRDLAVLGGLAARAIFARAQSNVTVFVSGLNNPRGLRFGRDGELYVAEGGIGGTLSV